MCSALRLSQYRTGGVVSGMCRSLRRNVNQVISTAVLAMERYSASVLEREIVCCFFEHHEIRFLPRKMQ